ncbi:MAG: hypothetical protein WBC91_25685 [Phototrophicaceae bacterium]
MQLLSSFCALRMLLDVVGEYLGRTLDQSRNRPLYFIEERSDPIQK